MSQSYLQWAVGGVVKGVFNLAAPLVIAPTMSKNSLGCLEYVKENAQRGDPASVVRTIDEFAGKHMMMNVGEHKGKIVDAEIRRKRPTIMAELGSYTGYSTVRFASAQREAAGEKPSHYYAFEFSPVYASRVREMVEFAGLEDQVTVVEGAFADNLPILQGKAVDIFFVDHDKSVYVSDAKQILKSGTLRDGSLLIADNVLFPGTPDYLEFLEKESSLAPTLHKVPIEQLPILDDGISIATYSA